MSTIGTTARSTFEPTEKQRTPDNAVITDESIDSKERITEESSHKSTAEIGKEQTLTPTTKAINTTVGFLSSLEKLQV